VTGPTAAPPRRGRTSRRLAAAERDNRIRAAAPIAASTRGRRSLTHRGVGHRGRSWLALCLVLVMFGAATYQLVRIQTVDAATYSTKAAQQQGRTIALPASRGTIYDRNGTPLAFTVQGRALAAWPGLFTSDAQRRAVADIVGKALAPAVTADEVFTKLTDGKSKYVYLARGLMPAQAEALQSAILDVVKPADRSPITLERQDLREYPQGDTTQTIVGTTGWEGHGAGGIEIKFDSLLSGVDGERTVDVDSQGRAIPGTQRAETPAVDGGDVTLTLDADLQYTVTEMLKKAVTTSGAKGGMALVRSVHSPDVLAMTAYYQGKTPAEVGNMPVTSPFEPGSVMKAVVFGAALDQGLITPDTHYAVSETITMGGHVIHDAWPHSRVGMSATGILAKSSNVGTLMIAQQVGQDAFAAELGKYGLGQPTGIQLPADSGGVVPPQSQWSATSFANLPLGQGLSVTMVQLADMYQGIANGGVRIPPSIIASTSKGGVTTPTPERPPVRQLSAAASNTLLDMLRGTVQSGDMMHHGTAPAAALTGYQVAGKTGTAQQVDPSCGCYSKTKVTATFAGIVPADNPALVITVMLDAPRGGAEGGGVAAPLFKDIAAYALRAFDIPPSKTEAPIYDLYLNMGE
jgi:cell division protein FtsI (penicillin-binding protein 3)